jgi:hypothetical protein
MQEANLKIIARLKRFLTLTSFYKELIQKFSVSDRDFIRNRKLPFEKVVLFITKLNKKSLSIELENFFGEIGSGMQCSVSAFSQQRVKLKSDFFLNWNQLLQKCFYLYYGEAVKRWKGYRIVAADGSTVKP